MSTRIGAQATSERGGSQGFDRQTRNALARMVGQARERLRADVADQLRRLGFQEDGTVLDLDGIAGLSESERAAGAELRDLLDHFIALESGAESRRRQAAYDRLVREIGFMTFNRLVALRMAEERDLIVPSVGQGLASDGFLLYERIANGALGSRVETYRAYLECLFDEIAQDLPLLFDRGTPESHVFPSERCLEDVLALVNAPDLAQIWRQDEAIGWVYQYYNDPAERKKMREASSAPRNSRELAVRNQFFTPRYVVEFLTDNTLGRIWYEMRQGNTRLVDDCRYLVRRMHTLFLGPGDSPPLPYQKTEGRDPEVEHVPYRAKKDPRDLKILDPACGSGHFLLYAFDLLEAIYEEAWADDNSPAWETSGRTLREDYSELDQLGRAIPGLILRHNLHGIEIDPRACQIAGLALWLRAQRSYQRLGIKGAERPPITRSNVVCAEPMPGEPDMLDEYLKDIDSRLRDLVSTIWDRMRLAGEAGSLLKIEEEIAEAVGEARREAFNQPPVQMTFYQDGQFARQMVLDLARDEEERSFWERAESLLLEALRNYASRASAGSATRRRLFRDDAAQGFAFVDLCRQCYDVALMNPPFGEGSGRAKGYVERAYPRTKNDVYAAFVERWLGRLTPGGMLGAITSRTGFFLTSFKKWREEILLGEARVTAFADLGYGVLDSAMVETAAYCLEVAG
ncbi:MAG TPA: DNA methyltransferase [Chloroflexota bacterium]|nr:DNA methyltransferase [Chloroflexota bacterium]